MNFTRDDVLKLAKLARLHLSDDEVERYQKDLSSILGYFDQIQALDLEDVPELQFASSGANILRADEVSACDEQTRNRAIENFTNKEGDLLKVQAVFTNREE